MIQMTYHLSFQTLQWTSIKRGNNNTIRSALTIFIVYNYVPSLKYFYSPPYENNLKIHHCE